MLSAGRVLAFGLGARRAVPSPRMSEPPRPSNPCTATTPEPAIHRASDVTPPHGFDPITLYVVGVIFLATLIRSTLGFGEALVAVPLLALRTPVSVAAPLAVLVSIVVAGVVVAQDWRRIEIRSARGLILASLPGIPLGVLMLAKVNDHVVRLILGLVIIAFSVHALTMGRGRRLERDHAGWLAACGFLSGILGGAYGMNGPPLAVYGALRRWSPQQFRATLQGYFLPVSLVGLAGYLYVGPGTRPSHATSSGRSREWRSPSGWDAPSIGASGAPGSPASSTPGWC